MRRRVTHACWAERCCQQRNSFEAWADDHGGSRSTLPWLVFGGSC
jgi:hypothetical protein